MSLKYPDVEEETVTGGAGGEARGHPLEAQEPTNGNQREEERQEDVEDMEVAMARKRSAEVDSETLIEAAEEVVGSKKRVMEGSDECVDVSFAIFQVEGLKGC